MKVSSCLCILYYFGALTLLGSTCRVQARDTHPTHPWYPALMSYSTVLGRTQPQKLFIEVKFPSRLYTLDYIGTHATQDSFGLTAHVKWHSRHVSHSRDMMVFGKDRSHQRIILRKWSKLIPNGLQQRRQCDTDAIINKMSSTCPDSIHTYLIRMCQLS